MIDALTADEDGNLRIVDYKTGDSNPAKKSAYLLQQNLYRLGTVAALEDIVTRVDRGETIGNMLQGTDISALTKKILEFR